MTALSLIHRVGGKVRLTKYLLPYFPEHKCYVEPCVGGGSLFFAKEPSNVEVINDIDRELIRLYNVVRYHPDEFNEQLSWALRSRVNFEDPEGTLPNVTEIHKAVRYYLKIMLSFGSRGQYFGYWRSSRKAPLGRDWITLSQRLQTSHVFIENLDFRKIIEQYDSEDTFFYIDPPYEETAMPYTVRWTTQDTQDMIALLENLRGKFLLSWGGPVSLEFKRKVWKKQIVSAQSLSKAKKGTSRPPVLEWIIANYPLIPNKLAGKMTVSRGGSGE
ncbi:DNA adenine methylase [bacterium]|nr:DNA adenine methylase [bacterium]